MSVRVQVPPRVPSSAKAGLFFCMILFDMIPEPTDINDQYARYRSRDTGITHLSELKSINADVRVVIHKKE